MRQRLCVCVCVCVCVFLPTSCMFYSYFLIFLLWMTLPMGSERPRVFDVAIE